MVQIVTNFHACMLEKKTLGQGLFFSQRGQLGKICEGIL
jgi:hypothetical protein